jgi:hypothetical protein
MKRLEKQRALLIFILYRVLKKRRRRSSEQEGAQPHNHVDGSTGSIYDLYVNVNDQPQVEETENQSIPGLTIRRNSSQSTLSNRSTDLMRAPLVSFAGVTVSPVTVTSGASLVPGSDHARTHLHRVRSMYD